MCIRDSYKVYNKFTLNVQYGTAVQKQFQIVLSYNGVSKVLHKPIKEILDFDTTKYTKVLCNGCIWHYEKNLPDDLRQQLENVYPVLNYDLKKEYDIYEELKKTNRYPVYLSKQVWFYNHYLNTCLLYTSRCV